MKTWQPAALGIVLGLVCACGDVETVTTPIPVESAPRSMAPTDGPRRSISIGSQTPPSSVPSAYQHYTWLDVVADAGFIGNTAWGQSVVNYGGTNATADIDLVARNAQGTIVGSNSGHAQDSHILPGSYGLTASTNFYVSASCGVSAQGSARGSAWDSFFTTGQSMLTWGLKSASDTKTALQPACAPPPTCQDAKATNYGGALPCAYPAPTGGGTTPPTNTSGVPTYYPPPSYPTGHWECVTWNAGTAYEQRYCTWYAGYGAKIASSGPSLARLGATEPVFTANGADLPTVSVIVSDQLPSDAMAVIERHRQGPQTNVLLVPSSNIRPAVLVAAMQALYESRAKDGESPNRELTLQLKGTVLDQHIPAALRNYATTFAGLIASAKRGNAGAYGMRQIVELRMGAPKQ